MNSGRDDHEVALAIRRITQMGDPVITVWFDMMQELGATMKVKNRPQRRDLRWLRKQDVEALKVELLGGPEIFQALQSNGWKVTFTERPIGPELISPPRFAALYDLPRQYRLVHNKKPPPPLRLGPPLPWEDYQYLVEVVVGPMRAVDPNVMSYLDLGQMLALDETRLSEFERLDAWGRL